MTAQQPSLSPSPWKHLACLAILAIPLLMVGLNNGTPDVNAERRALKIATTMIETGDYMVPRLNGHAHLTKPPLFHWAAVTICHLRGRVDLTSIRLVSAISAYFLVVLIYFLGWRLYNQETGWWASILAITTYGLITTGHSAMFDAMLTMFIVLSILGYLEMRQDRPRLGAVLLVLGLVGGFMTKGFLAWLVPVLPIGIDCWRRGRKSLRLWPILGLAGGVLLLVAPYYLYLIFRVPEAGPILLETITVNFGVKAKTYGMTFHPEPLPFYLYTLPVLMLPWTLLAVPVCRRLWTQRRELLHRPEALLIGWLILGIIMLTVSPAKASRYAIPLLPAWLILAGNWLANKSQHDKEDTRWLRLCLYMLAGLMFAMGLGLPFWLWARIGVSPWIGALVLVWCVLIGGLCWFFNKRQRWQSAIVTVILLMVSIVPFYFRYWYPAHSYLRHNKKSAEYAAYKERMHSIRQRFQPGSPDEPDREQPELPEKAPPASPDAPE